MAVRNRQDQVAYVTYGSDDSGSVVEHGPDGAGSVQQDQDSHFVKSELRALVYHYESGIAEFGTILNQRAVAFDRPFTTPPIREVANVLVDMLSHDPVHHDVAADIHMMLSLAQGSAGRLNPVQVPLSERARALMQRVEIERAVRQSVLAEGTYSASEVGDLLGSNSKNPRDKASRLRQAGDLLGVEVAGSMLYPAFQFDATRASLRPGVAPTNRALHAKDDGWAVASWWLSPHARLDRGVRPADLALAGDEASLSQLVAAMHAD